MTNSNENSVLVGTGRNGDFVHQGQDMAKAEGFRNVSGLWYDKTISIDDGIDKIEDAKRQRQDIVCPVKQMTIGVSDDGDLVLRHVDGREFRPTEHALKQVANWCDKVPHGLIYRLTQDAVKPNGKLAYSRDRQDVETLASVYRNGKRRIDPEKQFRFRTYTDGTLRAMLSEQYAPVDNVWYLEQINARPPTARLSHWKGDADTIFGNILIPDSIRKEADSDYGGMISPGNCEIGKRRLEQYPSLFRAICMNGCIWDQEKGKGISKVHRGEIDLKVLSDAIADNLNSQIPLIDSAIERFLATRKLEIQASDNVAAIFATIASDFKMTHGTLKSQLVAVAEEYRDHESENNNLFGIVNAVTRAGQRDNFSREDWLQFDMIGGKLSGYTADNWDRLRKRANAMDSKKLDAMFSAA